MPPFGQLQRVFEEKVLIVAALFVGEAGHAFVIINIDVIQRRDPPFVRQGDGERIVQAFVNGRFLRNIHHRAYRGSLQQFFLFVPSGQQLQQCGVSRDPVFLQPEKRRMKGHLRQGEDTRGREVLRRQQHVPFEGIGAIQHGIILDPEDLHLIAVRIPVDVHIRSSYGREPFPVDFGSVQYKVVRHREHGVGEENKGIRLHSGGEIDKLPGTCQPLVAEADLVEILAFAIINVYTVFRYGRDKSQGVVFLYLQLLWDGREDRSAHEIPPEGEVFLLQIIQFVEGERLDHKVEIFPVVNGVVNGGLIVIDIRAVGAPEKGKLRISFPAGFIIRLVDINISGYHLQDIVDLLRDGIAQIVHLVAVGHELHGVDLVHLYAEAVVTEQELFPVQHAHACLDLPVKTEAPVPVHDDPVACRIDGYILRVAQEDGGDAVDGHVIILQIEDGIVEGGMGAGIERHHIIVDLVGMGVKIIIQLFFQDHLAGLGVIEHKTEDRQIDDHTPYLILGLIHPLGQITYGKIIGIIPVGKFFQEIERVLGIHVLDLVVGLVVEKVGGPEPGFPDGRSPQAGEERLVLIRLPDETVGRNVQLVVGIVIRTGGHEVIRLVKGYLVVRGVVVEGDVGMVDRVLVHEKGDGRFPAGDVILMYSKEDGPDQ